MEIQYLIAYVCYDSPRVAQRGDSLNEAELAKEMSALFYGGDGDDQGNTVTFLDQFINGIYKFNGLFTTSEDPDEEGQIVLTMPQKLHRYNGVRIFVGPGSITKELVSQTNFTNTTQITGASLLSKAKIVIRTCKKMMALVMAPGSPYRDGNFPSGTNWDDYIKWCIVAWQKECEREADEKKITRMPVPPAAATDSTAPPEENEIATATAAAHANANDAAGAGVKDPNPYMKGGSGFLAWALYGHIPLHDGAGMASLLFSEAKAKTSYGRGSKTRTAMRKAAIAASSMVPVDNRRGKKQKRELEDVHAVNPNNNDSADLALFAKTIAHLEVEALENEEKQQHGMCVRLVRDKLTACRRRSDILLQQLQLFAKSKKGTTALFDKLEATEAEVEKLECELVALEERECGRHMQMLEKKRCMALAANIERTPPMIGKGDSFDSFTSSGLESSSSSGGHNESGGNDDIVDNDNNGDGSDGSNNTATASSMPYNDGTKCMECNTIPTDHICSKCKKVRVCSICCDTNRDLQNNPWCKVCFESETPASQEIIRNGNYNYK